MKPMDDYIEPTPRELLLSGIAIGIGLGALLGIYLADWWGSR